MLINPNQIRAARGLLDWTVAQLAQKVGVGTTTISAIETGRSSGSIEVFTSIRNAFEAAGIELTKDGGVRPFQSRTAIYSYKNHEGFKAFFDDVYQVAQNHANPDICITSVDEKEFNRWLDSYVELHEDRMADLKIKKLKVLLKEDDLIGDYLSYCEYRWIPNNQFADVSFYIYGDKAAFIEFLKEEATITCVHSQAIANSLRKLFEVTWVNAFPKSKI